MTDRTTRRQVAALLRKCLRQGALVEIDGLGVFQQNDDGTFRFTPQSSPKVFIAYAEEDLPVAGALCEDLRRSGINPWLDREKLLPGQNWLRRIEDAIELSDRFIALFSSHSAQKRGTFQSELRYALDCATRLPLDHSFVIPARLEECHVPQKIRHTIQYVDLFPDWDEGVGRLVRAVKESRPPPEI